MHLLCTELSDKQELLRVYVRSGRDTVEIDAARQANRIELHGMVASVDVGVDQRSDVLAEGVIDGQCYV